MKVDPILYLYNIQFMNNGKNYQLYVREISNSNFFGFLEIGDFVFTTPSTLLVDPGVEKLKNEFSNVIRSYIPVQTISRIDVLKDNTQSSGKDNVIFFPFCPPKKPK
ncbi:MAG: DUF1820 family protein [Candidatus Dasytiphilus stammeri]